MSIASVQQMADRVSELIETRLDIRGMDLSSKLDRAGRLLPRHVRAAAELLAASAAQSRSPKLCKRLDPAQIASSYDTCIRYLKPLGARSRRRAFVLSAVMRLLVAIAAATLIATIMVLARRLG